MTRDFESPGETIMGAFEISRDIIIIESDFTAHLKVRPTNDIIITRRRRSR
jgi:hypothetical protein